MINKALNRVSFSSVSSFYFCPHFFKLSQIDNLKVYENTVYTIWGKLLHANMQDVLLKNLTASDAVDVLCRKWKRFCSLYKLAEFESWMVAGSKALLEIEDDLVKEFGSFKVLSVEQKLEEKICDQYPQIFKGFIDLVIQLEKDNSIVILDIKSCASHFMFYEYKETYKDYQLTLYKHFLTQKLDLKEKVETYFLTVERNHKSKQPVKLTRITSGPKKVKNALAWVEGVLYSVSNSQFPKNRSSCHKYSGSNLDESKSCCFFNSEHCKSSICR